MGRKAELREAPVFPARAEDGLRESVEYALSHPEAAQPDPDFDNWCDGIVRAQG